MFVLSPTSTRPLIRNDPGEGAARVAMRRGSSRSGIETKGAIGGQLRAHLDSDRPDGGPSNSRIDEAENMLTKLSPHTSAFTRPHRWLAVHLPSAEKVNQMLKLDYLILFPVLPYLFRSQDLFSESPQLLTRKSKSITRTQHAVHNGNLTGCHSSVDCVGDPLSSCNSEMQQCVCSPAPNNISTLLVVNQTFIQCIIGE